MEKIRLLGIFGGTFDPIHYGHLIAAEYARSAFSLDKVLIIPSKCPPHKNAQNITAEKDRYEMAKIAISDNPFFEISPVEMERPGYSYTIDTVEYCLNIYPGANIYVIIGADCLCYLNSWKAIERLMTMARFITVTRPGYSINRNDETLADLPPSLWENILQLQVPGLDISSSEIRERVAKNRSIRYFLPPDVESYIMKNGLYKKEAVL